MNSERIYPFGTEDGERNEDFIVEVTLLDDVNTKRVHWMKYLTKSVAQRSEVILDISAACSGCAHISIDGPVIDGVELSVFLCSYHYQCIMSSADLDTLVCPQWSMIKIYNPSS